MYDKPIIAVVGFGGWSELLAGKRIDDRRKNMIYVARTLEEVLEYVDRVLGILKHHEELPPP